ncbi:hypothetical protein ACFE04_024883 [Oxalis oulophora]
MGAFCCCSRGDDLEEYSFLGNSIFRNCVCLRFFFHQLFSGYGATFHRLEGRPISSSVQGPTPLSTPGITATALSDNETRLVITRSAPYDTEQRYSRLQQRDGLVSRRDKSMTHFQEDSQQLRRNMSTSAVEALSFAKTWITGDSQDDSKLGHPEASEKGISVKVNSHVQQSSEEEDVCPTCLDDYTPENPKITTKCSHHFHLGCIYEWLERSNSCPICGKEMEFCESP